MSDPQLPQGLDEGDGSESEDDENHQVRACSLAKHRALLQGGGLKWSHL